MKLIAVIVAVWAVIAVLLFACAALLWVDRYCARLRGKPLPPMRMMR